MNALEKYRLAQKPQIELLPNPIAPDGSKNYLFNVLKQDIERFAGKRNLDAGAGMLRNTWMFKKGVYCGVNLEYELFKKGLVRFKGAFSQHDLHRFQLVACDLNSNIPRLGAFDLCVCTNTLLYVKDPFKTIQELIDVLNQKGNLILQFDLDVDKLEEELPAIAEQFENVELIYCYNLDLMEKKKEWFESSSPEQQKKFNMPAGQVMADTLAEMKTENRPELHGCIYIRGLGKLDPSAHPDERLGKRNRDGIFVLDDASPAS